MTTIYGDWKPNATTTKRARLRVDFTVPSPSAGQTSITVTGQVRAGARYSYEDANNTFAWSGTLLGSGSTSKNLDVATDGEQVIHTFSVTVPLTDTSQSKYANFSLTGIDYIGASVVASVTASVTIPARVILAPNAPSSATVARVSDTRHDLAWTATATADRPIASFEVQKWRLSTGAYAPQASVSGSARSYVDNGNHPNDQLEWRIRAVNAAGASAWVYFPAVWTTPAAATNVTVARVGADATVSWTINARDASHQDLRYQSSSDGGATWSEWAWVPGHTGFSATATSRVVSGLDPVKQHRIGVVSARSNPDLGIGGLYGYSAASAPLALLTAPQAPTPLAPTGTVSSQDAVTLRWRHNAVDTTPQTAAEVEHRLAGGTWTLDTATSAQELTFAAGEWPAGPVEWRARTKGEHADWSPWSAVATFTVAQPPAVAITAPTDGTTIASNRLTATLTYSDPQGAPMVGWRAELYRDGQLRETLTGTGAATLIAFQTPLENGIAYSAKVRVTSGSGLTSAPDEATVTIEFARPTAPIIEAAWDEENGTVQLAANNPPAEVFAWTGTPHESTSTRLQAGATVTNLAVNPSFESDNNLPAGVTVSTEWAASGTRSLYVPLGFFGLSPFGTTPFGL